MCFVVCGIVAGTPGNHQPSFVYSIESRLETAVSSRALTGTVWFTPSLHTHTPLVRFSRPLLSRARQSFARPRSARGCAHYRAPSAARSRPRDAPARGSTAWNGCQTFSSTGASVSRLATTGAMIEAWCRCVAAVDERADCSKLGSTGGLNFE